MDKHAVWFYSKLPKDIRDYTVLVGRKRDTNTQTHTHTHIHTYRERERVRVTQREKKKTGTSFDLLLPSLLASLHSNYHKHIRDNAVLASKNN